MDEIGPAATLSILVKAQGVQSTAGQLKGLDAAGRKAGSGMAVAETHAKRSSKTFSALGVAAKSAGVLVGAAGLAAGVKSAVSEFREAQKTGAQTTAVLKSTGGAAKVSTKQIQDLANAISKKSGIDDEAIQSGENLLLTFTKLRNETGKGNDIFNQATQIITDMSVSLKQGLKPSAIQVGKALNDPIKGITALRRVGVAFTAEQEKQIKTLVKSGDLLGAQKMVLKELRTEFAGSAAAQATAGDKFKVALNNLAEAAGAVLVPQLDKVARYLTTLMNEMTTGVGVGGALVSTFRTTGNAIASVVGVIAGLVKGFREGNAAAVALGITLGSLAAAFLAYKTLVIATSVALRTMAAAQVLVNIAMTANPIGLMVVGLAALAAALVIAYVKIRVFREAVNGTFNWIKDHWPLLLGILTGPIGLAVLAIAKNWSSIKAAFSSGVSAIIGILRGSVGAIAGAGKAMGTALINAFKSGLNFAHELAMAMRDLIAKAPGYAVGVGKAIVRGIIDSIKGAAGGIGDAIGGAIKGAVPKIPKIPNPFGDGTGQAALPSGGKGAGNLFGANRALAPFAALGGKYGLHVSAGRTNHSKYTSSGNISNHFLGQAIDMANGKGPDAEKMAYAKMLVSRYGSSLAELIYTPLGFSIKNGKRVAPIAASDHYDHVHVALGAGGKAGVGDGTGIAKGARKAFTGDGIGVAIAAARKAGFTGEALVRMVAIAGRESHYNPRAANYKPPDHSIGLWQINQLAHHGRFGSDAELMDPDTNAHAAWVLSSGGKNFGPWSTNRGLSPALLKQARDAIKSGKGASSTAGTGAAKAGGKTDSYAQAIASADVAIAGAKTFKAGGGAVGARTISKDLVKYSAILQKEKVMGTRIRKIRAALGGKLTKPTRLRLTQELAQLIPEHQQLARDRAALRAPAAPVDTGAGADVGGGGGDGGEDPNQPLIDAINAAAEEQRIHDELIKQQIALQETIRDEQRKFANVSGSNYATLAKAISDVASGQIGGKVGLGFMSPSFPGGGSRY